MTDKPIKLSDTALAVLGQAAERDNRLASMPPKLPPAARNTVIGSLLKQGLLAQVPAPRDLSAMAWRQDKSGARVAVRITDAGLRAIGLEPSTEPHKEAQVAPTDAVTKKGPGGRRCPPR